MSFESLIKSTNGIVFVPTFLINTRSMEIKLKFNLVIINLEKYFGRMFISPGRPDGLEP